MKKYTYLVNFDSQTLERVGESFAVKGDGGIAELKFVIPSNFGVPANQALWRVFFKLPGEKESLFETLPAVTATESGDYVTGWVISKAITQKAGRLAFSLAAISGNDIQWNSRTVILQVPESQYQPESEEAEEPYTGRLTALEGDMAAIRGEFDDVVDEFNELKETATLGTPIPKSLASEMVGGGIYLYTGTEPGYTAGHVYYYVNGSLTDGGVYGGTAVDATLTQSGQAADAKKTGDEIAGIKEDLSDKVGVNGENQVSVENAVFLDTVGVNVCDGVPHDGYAVAGDQINGYRLDINAARYNLMIAKIKPNTTYTVIAQMTDASVMPLFRLVTSEQIVAVNEYLTGSVRYEVSNKTKPIYTFTSGANDNYVYIYGVSYASPARDYFIQIAEGVIDDFTTDKYSWYVGYPNDRLKLTYKDAYTPKIKIIPQSATQFTVNVLDEASGEYIGHRFDHLHLEDTLSYGTSQSKTIVTEDVWYASYIIAPNGDFIMQGNTNFIHYVGNMSGHEGHVGAGHGCCVAMVERFLADGKEFVPSELTSPIECSAFTFIEVVKHYLNDRQKSMEMFPTSYSSHAIPTLDSNGDPIVTGIEYLVGEWSGNSVKIRNRFDIKLDNISFQQCHAGMLTGFYPYFTDFAINSKPYVWNHTHSDDYVRTNVYTSDSGCTFVNTDVCGSGVVVNPASSPVYMADEVFMLGEKYFAKKRMIQNVPTRYDKSNVMMWVPPNGDARLKAYFMPCICTSHATGETAEVFNDGDVLDTNVELVIGVHAAQ